MIKLRDFFCKTKSKNLLATAFGIWKICVVTTISEMNHPLYRKKAGTHLIVGWTRSLIKKMMLLALQK